MRSRSMLTPRFIIDRGLGAFRGDVVHLPDDPDVTFRPSPHQAEHEQATMALGTAGARLLLNELELLVQAGTHRVLWPNGACPGDLSWEETDQEPVAALPGALHLVDRPLAPVIRLGDVGEWQTRINRRQQTIFLTHWTGTPDEYVEICTGVVAGLAQHELVSLQVTSTHPMRAVDPAGDGGAAATPDQRPDRWTPLLVPRFAVLDGMTPLRGELVHAASDHAFDFHPDAEQAEHEQQTLELGGHASLLLNHLQLVVDTRTHRVLFPWGLCPAASWDAVDLAPVAAPPGALYVYDAPLDDGQAIGLGEPGDWDAGVNHHLGTVFLTRGRSVAARHVEICSGVVAGMADHQLVSLRLTPTWLP